MTCDECKEHFNRGYCICMKTGKEQAPWHQCDEKP